MIWRPSPNMITATHTKTTVDSQVIKVGSREISHEEAGKLAIATAVSKKATRPILLNLVPQGGFTEYFAIVSVQNSRQAYAVAEAVRLYFKDTLGILPVSIDGMESQNWVLLDFGFLFVHVFLEPTREAYKLEQLWNKAHVVEVTEPMCDALLKEIESHLPKVSNEDL